MLCLTGAHHYKFLSIFLFFSKAIAAIIQSKKAFKR